jgi:hypothetical protein
MSERWRQPHVGSTTNESSRRTGVHDSPDHPWRSGRPSGNRRSLVGPVSAVRAGNPCHKLANHFSAGLPGQSDLVERALANETALPVPGCTRHHRPRPDRAARPRPRPPGRLTRPQRSRQSLPRPGWSWPWQMNGPFTWLSAGEWPIHPVVVPYSRTRCRWPRSPLAMTAIAHDGCNFTRATLLKCPAFRVQAQVTAAVRRSPAN